MSNKKAIPDAEALFSLRGGWPESPVIFLHRHYPDQVRTVGLTAYARVPLSLVYPSSRKKMLETSMSLHQWFVPKRLLKNHVPEIVSLADILFLLDNNLQFFLSVLNFDQGSLWPFFCKQSAQFLEINALV